MADGHLRHARKIKLYFGFSFCMDLKCNPSCCFPKSPLSKSDGFWKIARKDVCATSGVKRWDMNLEELREGQDDR